MESVYIYGSYRKIKTRVLLFWTTLYLHSVHPASSAILYTTVLSTIFDRKFNLQEANGKE